MLLKRPVSASAAGETPPTPSPPSGPLPPVQASEGEPGLCYAPSDWNLYRDTELKQWIEPAGPEDGLPPRWGSYMPGVPAPLPEHQATPGRNPFVGKDRPPPLVMAAQGSAVSGARSIGFTTGGAQVRCPLAAFLPSCLSGAGANADAADCQHLPLPLTQDIENFRENVKAGYLPLPTDVTFEGIAKDYYFNTRCAQGPGRLAQRLEMCRPTFDLRRPAIQMDRTPCLHRRAVATPVSPATSSSARSTPWRPAPTRCSERAVRDGAACCRTPPAMPMSPRSTWPSAWTRVG
jgi:hypothetical protein